MSSKKSAEVVVFVRAVAYNSNRRTVANNVCYPVSRHVCGACQLSSSSSNIFIFSILHNSNRRPSQRKQKCLKPRRVN